MRLLPLALAALLLPLRSLAFTYYTETVDGIPWTYIAADGKADIYSDGSPAIPTSTSGAITIPSTLGGNTVVSVGDCALENCSSLTSVTIPDSVTRIRAAAFSGCSTLASVTIPDSVKEIGSEAFKDCNPSLYDTTTIPGVTLVDGWAIDCEESFSGSLDLTGIRGIGNAAFFGCSGLVSVTIPDSVSRIGDNAFSSCTGLVSVKIPASVSEIGMGAFWCCSGLVSLTIPNSVTSIEWEAFGGCTGLAHLSLPDRFEGKTDDMYIPEGCKVVFYHGETPPDPTAIYAVAFAANGGTGTMTPLTPAVGETVALPKSTFTRKGYVFAGWALTENGNVAYEDGASVKDIAKAGGAVILYAQWAKKNYKVKFYANGGSGKMAVEKMTYGKAKKLSKNKFKRSGYKFKGWATSKSKAKKGTVAYKNKKKVKNLTMTGKTIKLYAVWKRR